MVKSHLLAPILMLLVEGLFRFYLDFFQPEEVDVVREALNELSVDNDDAHAEIIQKMELLTH